MTRDNDGAVEIDGRAGAEDKVWNWNEKQCAAQQHEPR